MKTRDSLITELKDIKQQMSGISPKLSIYTRLKERAKQITTILGGLDVELNTEDGKIKTRDGFKFINRFQRPK